MVYHACVDCHKIFHKKSAYVRHINKKKKCIKIEQLKDDTIKQIKDDTIEQIKDDTIEQLKDDTIEQLKDDNKIKDIKQYKNMCIKCNRTFSRSDNLKRHINICNCVNDIIINKNNVNELLQSIKIIENNLVSFHNLITNDKNDCVSIMNNISNANSALNTILMKHINNKIN